MRKDRLLESYIRSYLIKEDMRSDESDVINSSIERLEYSLKSKGLSIEALDFSPRLLTRLRDKTPIKDLGNIARKKPESVEFDDQRDESESYDEIISNQEELMVGLGFNPINRLRSEDTYYIEKIEEFIKILDTFNRNLTISNRAYDLKRFLKNVLLLKEAIDESGLKVVGAGVYRVALMHPSASNFIIKLGLSEKGRKDCKHEIEFGLSRGLGRIQHVQNFPKIYNHDSENFAWYAAEKAIFFTNETFNNPPPNFFKDLNQQFNKTFKFFRKIISALPKDQQGIHIVNVFEKYIGTMFYFKKDEVKKAHAEYSEMIKSRKNNKILQAFNMIMDKIKELLLGINQVDSNFKVPEQEVFNRLFKERFSHFLENFAKNAVENLPKAKRVVALMKIYDKLDNISSQEINKVSSEIFDMFDQVVVTNLRDVHLGNLGFKKVVDDETHEEKWKLIFTDIDSN